MRSFCTLFDSHYFTRGLAAYYSLKEHCSDFHLYIFAFDENTRKTLINLALEYVTVISLKEFEDEKLLEVKPGRTIAEYCWTCTASVILYVLDNYDVDSCTYIDSDLYFFDNPAFLFDENKNASIIITEHRFSANYIQYEVNGKYNVQFMFFKNNKEGREAVIWWRERCIEWCFSRAEDGKFGDQKYLDDWCKRFKNVHVMVYKGGGVAPWNVQEFSYYMEDNKIMQKSNSDGSVSHVVFYHFHNFKIYQEGFARLISYNLSMEIFKYLYEPYLKRLLMIEQNIGDQFPLIAKKGFVRNDFDGFYIRQIMKKMEAGDFSGDNIIVYNAGLFKHLLNNYNFIPLILRKIENIKARIINKIRRMKKVKSVF